MTHPKNVHTDRWVNHKEETETVHEGMTTPKASGASKTPTADHDGEP